MDRTGLKSFLRPVIILFIAINAFCVSCGNWLDKKEINHIVLMYANLLFFLLTLTACFIHIKALGNKNPHAFVRSVTLASFIKLITIAVSIGIYLIVAGKTRSVYAVAVAMIFYIVYTIFEVKGAMSINRRQNADN